MQVLNLLPMKKNKGKKRKEVDSLSRKEIVKTLTDFQDNDYAKVFPKEFFYFNKQALMLTNLDYKDRTIDNVIEENKKSIKLIPTKIIQNDIQIIKFEDFTSTLESIKRNDKKL